MYVENAPLPLTCHHGRMRVFWGKQTNPLKSNLQSNKNKHCGLNQQQDEGAQAIQNRSFGLYNYKPRMTIAK